MNNPLFILQTLDRYLDHPVELTLYGRAALALGFAPHLTKHETTQDVDVIVPIIQLDAFQADEKFWAARDATNAELRDKGLYMTHLFTEMDVFLQPDWMSRRVSIPVSLKSLNLFRPGAIDLVLTKMMRGADPEDLVDIEFILKLEPLSQEQLSAAFQRARVPDIRELHDAFRAAQPKVLALARNRSPKS